jgi:Cu/Ag efflux protein CusF
MKQQSIIIAAALSAVFSIPAFAQQKADSGAAVVTASAPGKVAVAATVKVSATVESIDPQTRDVVLKGPKGELTTVTAGPEVRRFGEIKVGDRVVAQYVEALSLTLKKDGKELRGRSEKTLPATALQGGAPAGGAGRSVEVTADVTAVNTKKKTVTLRGPKQTVELQVRDPEQLKLIKVGDQIEAVYVQAVAVALEPAKGAAKK